MASTRLRPMTVEDIEPAVASILADDWGDRRGWFDFALSSPSCHVFAAEGDGRVVGTGVLTIHGPVGWIGTIWVASGWRRQGLGLALTEATIEAARDAACRTLLLVATEAGRPLYERLGFEVQTWYRTMEARPVPVGRALATHPDPAIRAFRTDDLSSLVALDHVATGEDRSESLARLAMPDATRVLERDGAIVGFVARAPWGGGATIAPRIEDAMTILDARRVVAAPGRHVRCGILLENEAGADALEAAGWVEAWRAPRLILGDPLDWHPDHIWGQFNHAMG